MYHYRYATKDELKPVKAELEEIIHRVQNEVRDDFTFSYYYVGSSAKNRNLVTYDPTTQIGFDFEDEILIPKLMVRTYSDNKDHWRFYATR